MTYDEIWLLAINQGWHHPLVDALMVWLSSRWTFSIPLLFALLWHAWRTAGGAGVRVWLVLALAVGAGDAVGNLAKDLVGEPRPCAVMAEALLAPGGGPLGTCGGSIATGMPSSHALNFFLVATLLALLTPWRRWQLAMLVVAVGVALSRIYLGKHYPSQVAAGALIGMGLGMLVGGAACYYRWCLDPRPMRRARAAGGSAHSTDDR